MGYNTLLILSKIYLLASKVDAGGWANSYFGAIRQKALEQSGAVTSLAMALGCIFVVFRFIKMYYDFVSDEQNGGFGGVSAKEIFRPIIMLVIIGSFGFWAGMLDGVTSGVSSAMVANMNAKADASEKKLREALEKLEEDDELKTLDKREKARQIAYSQLGVTADSLKQADKDVKDIRKKHNKEIYRRAQQAALQSGKNLSGYGSPDDQEYKDALEEVLEENGVLEEYEKKVKLKSEFSAKEEEAYNRILNQRKWMRYLNGGKEGFLGSLVGTLFNIFMVIMIAFCEITLSIFLAVGPFVFAFSVLDPWKDNYKKWIGSYIEVMLWKPVACAIAWVVMSARVAIADNQLQAATKGLMDLSSEVQEGSIIAAMGIQALIVFAGVIAIVKVPTITSQIFNLGSVSGSGSMGEAGGGYMMGAASAAPKAAGKVIKGATSGMTSNYVKAGQSGFASRGQKIGSGIVDRFTR